MLVQDFLRDGQRDLGWTRRFFPRLFFFLGEFLENKKIFSCVGTLPVLWEEAAGMQLAERRD